MTHAIAGVLVVATAFGCAFHLYRFRCQNPKPSLPITAILIIAITALITGLQFVFPDILSDFRRNRDALLAGEWWRMVTPLFVQADGWKQCCVNGAGAIIFCPLAERFYGKRLLALYFIPGVLGEIFAYRWNPNGAGSSLAIAGVAGGLFTFAILHRQHIHPLARILAISGVVGAVALCFLRDVHGPPLIIGALLAGLMMLKGCVL